VTEGRKEMRARGRHDDRDGKWLHGSRPARVRRKDIVTHRLDLLLLTLRRKRGGPVLRLSESGGRKQTRGKEKGRRGAETLNHHHTGEA